MRRAAAGVLVALAGGAGAAGLTDAELLEKRWAAAVHAKVASVWLRPDAVAGPCDVVVELQPEGAIGAIAFGACPDDPALRASVTKAIANAAPLPYAGFETVYASSLKLRFDAGGTPDSGEDVHEEIAAEVARRAAAGDAAAQHELGDRARARGDARGAAGWYRKAADGGHAPAQLALGRMLARGDGVPADRDAARALLRRAADADVADAHYELGVLAKDDDAAAHFRRAAALGSVPGLRALAKALDYGQGDPDPAEIVRLYTRAADAGDGEAAYLLGVVHDQARRVERDATEAVRWFRRGAELGVAAAQFNLAVSYDDGDGVERDDAQALEWYRRAAMAGDTAAQRNLGIMYRDGEGVAATPRAAYFWLKLASRDAEHKPWLRQDLAKLLVRLTLTGELAAVDARVAAFEPWSDKLLRFELSLAGNLAARDRRLWSDPEP